MKYDDIPQFTKSGSYRVTVDWKYLLEHLNEWENERGGAKLDMNPDFQRLHVWTEEQQIAYVEYILRGGMSGRDIYFNCVGWSGDYRGPFVLVDGKQRLQAATKFLTNAIPVFNGHYFKDIEGRIRAHFNFNVNDLKTPKEVVQWYIEMNTGGTPHTKEEIEKARAILNSL